MFFSCNNILRNNKYTYTNILFVFPTLYIVFLNTINANQRELELYLQAYGGSLRQNGSKWILLIFLQFFVQIMLDQLIFFLVLWELTKDHSMRKTFTLGQR